MKKSKKIQILCLIFIITVVNIYLNRQINYEFIFTLILVGYVYIKLYPKYEIINHYNQLELLIPLYNKLNIKKHLPATKGYAASPDFLVEIVKIIEDKKPKVIIEAGS
jgi:hypothetical protein